MLIEIKEDILQEAQNGDIETLSVLSMLALGQRQEAHILFGDYNTMRGLSNLKELGSVERMVFKGIYQKIATHGAAYKKISFKAIISCSEESHKEQDAIYLNPRSYKKMNYTLRTKLLTENLEDSEFYRQIGLYYKRQEPLWGEIGINFESVLGGGSTVYTDYEKECISKEKFCLCLLDGDKKFRPTKKGVIASMGETYKKVKKIDQKYKPITLSYYGTQDIREIENLIPFECIEKMEKYSARFVILRSLTSDLAYFDMKLGLLYRAINENHIKEAWQGVFSTNKGIIDEIEFAYNYSQLCSSKEMKEDCKNLAIVKGMGESLLHDFNTFVNDNPFVLYNPILTHCQEEEWRRIGKLVFEWCCCNSVPTVSLM